MHRINQILVITSFLIAGIVYLFLSSVSMDSLMNGPQSGKTLVFLYLIIILGAVFLVRTFIFRDAAFLSVGIPDVFLFLFGLYVILNMFFHDVPFSLRLFEFFGLVLFYIVIRRINKEYYIWLYAALITGGAIQAIYGNLQLWGYFPSHHGLYKMTGSFFNPGPYAGYLCAVLPIAVGLYFGRFENSFLVSVVDRVAFVSIVKKVSVVWNALSNKNVPNGEAPNISTPSASATIIQVLAIATIIAIVLVLPASRSRAAWLAVIVSSGYFLAVKYELMQKLKTYFNTSIKKAVLIISSVFIIGIGIAGLYAMKKGSADGRLLIWKVSAEMIKDKPVFGYGFDRFKVHYMDYQATFFEQNPGSEEAMVAGDTNYAFNELLQQAVENGMVGLVLILLVMGSLFIVSGYRLQVPGFKFRVPSYGLRVPSYRLQVSSFKFQVSGWEQQLLWIARAGIVSIFVFALFSYPAQILPIKMSLVLYLATIGSFAPQKRIVLPSLWNKRKNNYLRYTACILFGGLILLLSFAGCKLLNIHRNAYRDWNSAYQLYQLGAYEDCLEDYEKAYPVLKTNGDFLTNYGKALSMAEKHVETIDILKQAAKYYPNTVVYTALGDSYKKLNQTGQAEQAYLHAWYMNPSRFYPKYLLARLYNESGQAEKATAIARELLEKEIKIESTAIEEIRTEMKEIIIKNKEGN